MCTIILSKHSSRHNCAQKLFGHLNGHSLILSHLLTLWPLLYMLVISRDNKSSELDLNNSNKNGCFFSLTLLIFLQSFFPLNFVFWRSIYFSLSISLNAMILCRAVRVEFLYFIRFRLWNIVNIKKICTKTRKTFSTLFYSRSPKDVAHILYEWSENRTQFGNNSVQYDTLESFGETRMSHKVGGKETKSKRNQILLYVVRMFLMYASCSHPAPCSLEFIRCMCGKTISLKYAWEWKVSTRHHSVAVDHGLEKVTENPTRAG